MERKKNKEIVEITEKYRKELIKITGIERTNLKKISVNPLIANEALRQTELRLRHLLERRDRIEKKAYILLVIFLSTIFITLTSNFYIYKLIKNNLNIITIKIFFSFSSLFFLILPAKLC